jgi:TusA-related sulfurtransferase
VHIDDGDSGDFIEANADYDTSVRLMPSLSTLEIRRLSAQNLGKTYRILVKAYNYAGVAESPILGVVFASLPS